MSHEAERSIRGFSLAGVFNTFEAKCVTPVGSVKCSCWRTWLILLKRGRSARLYSTRVLRIYSGDETCSGQ